MVMEIKRVVVTGGGGFLGKAIVKKLLNKNIDVTSFSRGYYPELEQLGADQVQGFFFGKPMPSSEMVDWLGHWNNNTNIIH